MLPHKPTVLQIILDFITLLLALVAFAFIAFSLLILFGSERQIGVWGRWVRDIIGF
jgi:hypothetical protein